MKNWWRKYNYFVIGFIVLVWIAFFDSNNLINLFQLRREISDLKDKKVYYMEEIAAAKKEQAELFSSPSNLEKFAREKYYMKKDNEDIFIILDKSKD